MAYRAVRMFGMFGEKTGYISADPDATSEKYNAMVDKEVKEILDVSPQSSFYFYFRLLPSVYLPC
jgi:hypothetical protein